MKSFIRSIVIVAALTAPMIAVAQQSTAPVTRAEVRADLVRLERAGYNPARRDDATYPADIQAAEARVAANKVAMPMSDTGMGTEPVNTSQSGTRSHAGTAQSNPYAHH
ncbi:DUF4148 domain-containing protein [Paraburkholderia fungorum]|uniref:DUF4148 domain-containing protein n=1 Tax=Paraburkholderia fungorum TaxID=134537 RepID=UPI00402B3FB5